MSYKNSPICLYPFYACHLLMNGTLCFCCPHWTHYPAIGDIKSQSVQEIWNSELSRYIRKQLYEGKWESICKPSCTVIMALRNGSPIFCDELEKYDFLTPELIDDIRHKRTILSALPTYITLSNSKICNLHCFMCGCVYSKDDPEVLQKTEKVLTEILPTARFLRLSGAGDPLARPDTQKILFGPLPNPSLRLHLLSNGLLLPRYWEQIKHHRFESLFISVNAGKPDSYERIQTGGKWENLIEALDLIKMNQSHFKCVFLSMVIMRYNYREIPEFLDLAERYGFGADMHQVFGDHYDRSLYGEQNLLQLGDEKMISELHSILVAEHRRTRKIPVNWGDLLDLIKSDSPKQLLKAQREISQEVSFDKGFYHDEGGFRWASPKAKLSIPARLLNGDGLISFHLHCPPWTRETKMVTILANGKVVRRMKFKLGHCNEFVVLRIRSIGVLQVEILSDHFFPISNDQRELAVQFRNLIAQPATEARSRVTQEAQELFEIGHKKEALSLLWLYSRVLPGLRKHLKTAIRNSTRP